MSRGESCIASFESEHKVEPSSSASSNDNLEKLLDGILLGVFHPSVGAENVNGLHEVCAANVVRRTVLIMVEKVECSKA